MNERWCLLCGAEYVAGVLECVDCVVPLSDRRPLSLDELGGPNDEQVVYEFDELAAVQRLAVDERFWGEGIAHTWDGPSLVVRSDDEDAADALIDRLDEEALLETGDDADGDDAYGDEVVYELDDWDDEMRGSLTELLVGEGIDHTWDEHGDLVVLPGDEGRVDLLIDRVEFPDQLPIDQDDGRAGGDTVTVGMDAHDVLSELFVAADRLMHDAADHEGVLSLVDAARMAEAIPLPYGFAPATWKLILEQGGELRAALEEDADDDTILGLAERLRATLRPLV